LYPNKEPKGKCFIDVSLALKVSQVFKEFTASVDGENRGKLG
jgi:hypothetical protein